MKPSQLAHREGNVVVTYRVSGLGYYGRPSGAVVTIRMEVQNITFDLPILGALLGLDDVTIPAMPVTVTSEDLNTDSGHLTNCESDVLRMTSHMNFTRRIKVLIASGDQAASGFMQNSLSALSQYDSAK